MDTKNDGKNQLDKTSKYVRTCESGIFVRIESRIESGCSRLRVQCQLPQELCKNEVIIIITDEQRCADSPGS